MYKLEIIFSTSNIIFGWKRSREGKGGIGEQAIGWSGDLEGQIRILIVGRGGIPSEKGRGVR
jgi:hypothetical protein